MLLRFVLTFICLWGLSGFAEGQQHYRIVSYNVENLFDIQDDPDTRMKILLLSGGCIGIRKNIRINC